MEAISLGGLTAMERKFIDQSRVQAQTRTRARRFLLACFVVTAVGAVVIVSMGAWQLAQGMVSWHEFEKDLGFWLVITASAGMIWAFTRSMSLAEQVIAKLYTSSCCPECGKELRSKLE